MNPYAQGITILAALIVGVGQCYLPSARVDYAILGWLAVEFVALLLTFAFLLSFYITAGGARFWLVYYPFLFMLGVNLSAWITNGVINWQNLH